MLRLYIELADLFGPGDVDLAAGASGSKEVSADADGELDDDDDDEWMSIPIGNAESSVSPLSTAALSTFCR